MVAAEAEEPAVVGRLAEPSTAAIGVLSGLKAVQKRFDCPYQRFLQGACFHEGRIYTLEGFTDSPENPPALRVVDAALGQEVLAVDFPALGLTVEPEMVEFSDGLCYYGDSDGNFYRLDF